MAVTIVTSRLRHIGSINNVPTSVRPYPIDSTAIRVAGGTWVDGGIGLGSLVTLETHANGSRCQAVLNAGLVTVDTDDRLDVSGHFSVTGGATSDTPVLGVSLKDCTDLSAGDEIPIALLRRGDILEGNLNDGIVGDTLVAEVATAAHVGARVGIMCAGNIASRLLNSTSDLLATGPGVWTFTLDVTSGVEFIGTIFNIVGVANDSRTGGGIGDTNVRVQVVWSPGPNITLF